MRRFMLPALLLLAAGVLVGCSEDETTAPVGDVGSADPCLDCHGDEDMLKSMLPETLARVTTRGDG